MMPTRKNEAAIAATIARSRETRARRPPRPLVSALGAASRNAQAGEPRRKASLRWRPPRARMPSNSTYAIVRYATCAAAGRTNGPEDTAPKAARAIMVLL
jgi:hypothetical protein